MYKKGDKVRIIGNKTDGDVYHYLAIGSTATIECPELTAQGRILLKQNEKNQYVNPKDFTLGGFRQLKRSDFVKHYPKLCKEWKEKLKIAFVEFTVEDTVNISEKLYDEMRKAADKGWQDILDELFGKPDDDNIAIKKEVFTDAFNKNLEAFCEEAGLISDAIQISNGVYNTMEERHRSLFLHKRYDWKYNEKTSILTAYLKK